MSLGEGRGKLTSEIWVVDLDVAEAVIVEDLQLRLVCFGDIGKIFLVAGVDVFRERATLSVSHVIPLRRRQRHLALVDSLFGYDALEIIPLVDVGAADVFDFAGADDAFAGLVAGFGGGGDVGHVLAEDVDVGILDFREAFHAGEEGAPEHCQRVSTETSYVMGGWSGTMTPIFAI